MKSILKKNASEIAKKYMDTHNISHAYVANLMNISSSNFNDRINGRLKFTPDFAFIFAKALKINPNIFLLKKYTLCEYDNERDLI
ncbi:hypothetical protein SAMN04487792_1609 [Lactobacillus bombicola]|uniref:XRE family transcriptional regulator n=1 Tax=Lactobacillus bombicola TaxID=1505723 RepID=A0A1I1TTN8_9LACO|nr:helix-turn-helix transcriptional regulator [Lactobacillus bombicola]SFD61967.1 hypothetical protein SAMN04487792_1609 [Lactobacillus bombicola]